MKSTFTGTTDLKGMKQDHGVYYYPNKFFKYEGGFVNNEKQGSGKLMMRDGSWYEGDFKNGEITGKGVLELFTGLRYEGKFLKGERHGFGVITKPSYKFEGNFREGKRHGSFNEFDYKKNTYIRGEYQDDALYGEVEIYTLSTNDLVFKGFIVKGKKEGRGEIFADGYYYNGEFANDVLHGEGHLKDNASGIVYKGEFVNNKMTMIANTMKYTLSLNKDNKKGETEKEEFKLAGPLKLEPAKIYTVNIKILYQGENYKNPEFDEAAQNTKKKNTAPEFLTPEPIIVTQESDRVFKYKIAQKFEEETAYKCDFSKEYLKTNDLNYQLDIENLATLDKNRFSTDQGLLEFNIVFPSNIKGGPYSLTISNVFEQETTLGFQKMNDIVISFDLVSKFGAKK